MLLIAVGTSLKVIFGQMTRTRAHKNRLVDGLLNLSGDV